MNAAPRTRCLESDDAERQRRPSARIVIAGLGVDGTGLQESIAGGGYETRLALTVDDLIRDAQSGWPDLVFLHASVGDSSLPTTIAQLRARVTQPLVVISANRDSAMVTAVLDAGADDHICEPIGSAELLARVRAHLRRINRP